MKKLSLIIISVIAVLALGFLFLNSYIQNRIEDRVNSFLPPSAYGELDIGFLGTSVKLTGVSYEEAGRSLQAQQISVKDINLAKYIFSNKIAIGEVGISEPSILIITGGKNDSSKQKQKFERDILVEKLQVSNGIFRLKKKDSSANEVYFRFPELAVSDIAVDSSTLKETVPFNYNSYKIHGDSLRLNMNPEHFIAASTLKMDNGKISIQDFRIIPYYDKPDFDRQVPFEKDRISLRVDSIGLSDLSFNFSNDTLHLKNPQMKVSGGNLQVYRNRKLPDDPQTKTLFAQKLRQLPMKVNLESVEVTGSRIEYEEGTERKGGPARISFYQVEGNIDNLTNMNLDREDFPRTTAKVSAVFMKETPLDVEISFNVTNLNNKFLVTGTAGSLPGRAMDPFLIPMRGMEAEGALQEVYFTFTGNDDFMTGDVKVNYDRFKINLLEEGSRDEKEILSALANLLVDNDGHTGENIQKDIKVIRDKTKSFWNYAWSGIQKGLMESVKQF